MSETRKPISYKEAGVDVAAGDEFVRRIRAAVDGTRTPQVIGGIGGFGGLFAADFGGMHEPVLVSSADGVGTKLRLAFATGAHARVGGDLVRHCVNDVAVLGARPLFFLDYLGTGRLEASVHAEVVSGMAEACREEGVALLGGETAEMPGFYADGEYDVAGFLVGVVERAKILDGSGIRPGDRVVAYPSTGLHTNGYSLARRVLAETGTALEACPPELSGATVGEALLAPHRCYAREIRRLLEDPRARVRGLAHITGGGISGNLSRILPAGVDARIRPGTWTEPAVFGWLRRTGRIEEEEMRRAFNLGVGLIAVVGGEVQALSIGEIAPGSGRVIWSA
jgi:phosphoribosylformylglycinamidine cyclo-ligase